MIAYKFLARGGVGRFSDFAWPPPDVWVECSEALTECMNGVHALRFDQALLDWIDDELWEVELAGTVRELDAMLVAERGRLVRRIEHWDEESALAFAKACALRYAATAARTLRSAGCGELATALEQAADLAAVQASASEVLEEVASVDLADVVGFAADLAALVSGNRPDTWLHTGAVVHAVQTPGAIAANAAFVAAHAAGVAASAGGAGEAAFGASFSDERARQFRELQELVADEL